MTVVTATIFSEGARVDGVYELMSIDIRREVNRIPRASLVYLDGDAAKRKFDLSDAKYFEPGKTIEIKLREESKTDDATVFKGSVVRHRVEANTQGSLLRVEMKDAAVKLTQARKSAVFTDQSDAEVIGKLIKDADLESGILDATQPKHPQIVQYHCTDWDFIVYRAESQGRLVTVEDGTVAARKASLSGKPKRAFDYGNDEIYELELELDADDQYTKVQGRAWDIKEAKLTLEVEAKPFSLEQGNLEGARLGRAVGFEPYRLSHPAPLAQGELQAWADARLMRSRLSMFRGRVSSRGFADVKLLDLVKVDGIGNRFNGKTLVTGICHRVDAAGWVTDVQFGLPARPFAFEADVLDAPAAGLLPAISGLHVAIVDKFEEDPDKQLRVKVIIPAIDEKTGSVWARLAAPDAGKNRGWFFRPEPGDEVVIGFFNDDPRQPVILGSLFSPKNTPPDGFSELTRDNKTKVLVTKTGSTLGFIDDAKGSAFIETADGARVLLDDSAKSLTLFDQSGNELQMNADGVTIKTAKDLKLEATGNVEIKGAKVNVK